MTQTHHGRHLAYFDLDTNTHTHKGANLVLLQIHDSIKHLQSLYFISIGDLPLQRRYRAYLKCCLGHTPVQNKYVKHFSLQRYRNVVLKGMLTVTFRRKDAFFYVLNSKPAMWVLLKYSQMFHRRRTNLENCRVSNAAGSVICSVLTYPQVQRFLQGTGTPVSQQGRTQMGIFQVPSWQFCSREQANQGISAIVRVLAANLARLTKKKTLLCIVSKAWCSK